MWKDLRFALRTLGRTPLFTAVAVLSLALGIGANTAIFSLLRQVLLRTLPVAQPEQIAVFHFEGVRNGSVMSDNGESVFSHPMYRRFRERNQVFSGLLARSYAAANVIAGGQAEQVQAEVVSGNYFEVLGVEARLGRLFTPADDVTPRGHPLAVLSYGYWSRRFGGSSAILNQTVRVNGLPMTVTGVAPRGFLGLISGQSPDLYVPLAMRALVSENPNADDLNRPDAYWLNIFGRLKPGITLGRAEAGIAPLYHALLEEDLAASQALQRFRTRAQANRVTLRPAAQGINQLQGQWAKPLVAVMAMVGLVLLIACANVASLQISRAAARRREIAIRLAIGAPRWTLVRQLLTESLLLALAGGVSGLAFTWWIARGLIALVPADSLGGWLTPDVDLRLLAFTFGISLLTGLLFGLAPALSATHPGIEPALRESGPSIARGQMRLRRALVSAQVALSLVLLIAAGLFARSLVNLLDHDLGFRAERLLIFRTNPTLAGYEGAKELTLVERLRERLGSLAGVVSTAAARATPFSQNHSSTNVTAEGYAAREDEDTDCDLDQISPGYFRTLGVPLVAGREFTRADSAGAPRVAIINEAFANYFFRGRNPIGLHMARGTGNVKLEIQIVGVVRNSVYSSPREKTARFYYLPYLQQARPWETAFLIRTSRDDATLPNQARRVVSEMDANIPVVDMRWMDAQVERSIYLERLTAWLAAGFGVLAMLLAAIGLYGVIAYMAAQRTVELGIRMALGATRGNIVWLVLREAGLLLAAGLAIGIPCALLSGRYVESQLFGIHAYDPAVTIAAAALLTLAALAAAYLPARRAAALDPLRALRYE